MAPNDETLRQISGRVVTHLLRNACNLWAALDSNVWSN
jgi:hypothetical protein